MSFPNNDVYARLVEAFPSWPALKTHLTGDGLRLRVEDHGVLPDSPYALIRYVKGVSNLENPVVRAFRSVVWDTLVNRPVSVTSWKSADGEILPEATHTAEYRVETFHDGTLIGLFWDKYSARWRIHTRSVLDAQCRYYSERLTFANMFWSVFGDDGTLDRSKCYSYVLQHPLNRIVCEIRTPTAIIVDRCTVSEDGGVIWSTGDVSTSPSVETWADVRRLVSDANTRSAHNFQGFVVKNSQGHRWKIRTSEYNRVRAIRGNSPRRDFLWLTAWKENTLHNYLALFPEERRDASALVNRWKIVTTDVYRIYCEAFKARTLDRKTIPRKYKPLVFGLHSLFVETLKPAGKTVDWKTCLEYMNARAVPQMLFVLSWEFRASLATSGDVVIPIEPLVVVGTIVESAVESAEDA